MTTNLFMAVPFLMLCYFAKQINGISSQGQALDNLYQIKFIRGNSGFDSSLFKAIDANRFEEHSYPEIYKQDRLKEKDKIQSLPGQPKQVNFLQYGGYVTVNEKAGRALYYYFVESSQSNKNSLPLLLWFNGGPGCSSLAYGAMQELGPFRVNSDGKTLYENKFSWIKAANVLFWELPAGTGFSYSNTTSDYSKSGDRTTAEDNYVFLLNWLERFPEYKSRELYISGESYAGHYVPELAHTILSHNKKVNKTVVNLKGIIMGNAVINEETDDQGMYEFYGTHALTSMKRATRVKEKCDFSPHRGSNNNNNTQNQIIKCYEAINEASADVSAIDIYNIYGPVCLKPDLTSIPKKTSLKNPDPCSDYYVQAYLNRPEVQEALHANVTKLQYAWKPCSDFIGNWNDSPYTMLPVLKDLMADGLRVWVYSGDIDGRVPVTSTQYSIDRMNLSVKTEWHPWFHKGEVGGYTQVYNGEMTFATVRGAGHMVPSTQPVRALALIRHFLTGKPLPGPRKSS